MLRYDARWLLDWYAGETPAHPGLPYARIGGAGPYRLAALAGDFRLTLVALQSPQLDYDETVVRLARFEPGQLWIQPCAYSDGIKSNYAMDGDGRLREALRNQYGTYLPPLGDARLSNAIGTAVVVFDASGRPYLPRRAPGQSVFPGGYHCTASGETVWRDGEPFFDGLFTANICRELEDEVGLGRADLEWIRPVALCREFLRGGKPQFFFAAKTPLGTQELTLRRRAAIERQRAAGRLEVLDQVLDVAASRLTSEVCTLECWANLMLAGWRE